MTARLQRFYGGHPAWWLFDAPIPLVNAYAIMLPRLQAEEALNTHNTTAMAMGTLPQRNAASLFASLKRQASGIFQRRKRPQPPNPAGLAAMGIAVEHVPAKVQSDG